MTIRRAIPAERKALEALQLRAWLGNEGDREALLRHSDTIDPPMEQIGAGGVFVLEQDGRIGFSPTCPAMTATRTSTSIAPRRRVRPARYQLADVDRIHERFIRRQHGLLRAARDTNAEHSWRAPPRPQSWLT